MLRLFVFKWAILSNLIKEDQASVSHFCIFAKDYRNPGKSASGIKALGFGKLQLLWMHVKQWRIQKVHRTHPLLPILVAVFLIGFIEPHIYTFVYKPKTTFPWKATFKAHQNKNAAVTRNSPSLSGENERTNDTKQMLIIADADCIT